MLKTLIILIVGITAGALILYGVANRTQQGTKITKVINPSSTNNSQTTPSVTLTEEEKLKKLRTQLYEQGITVTAKADKVYPGTGFILVDPANTRLFVHFPKVNVQQGQSVLVDGTIKRISGQENFRKESGFTPELNDFLKNQEIYIEAKDVKVSTSPTP
ncbi:hypothetical protein C4559_00430 [Candidatus Microgenomates bacterium]|nr:MAG: hypothetical protein C4559_00430 [Candidatus Microgenomates bacterium]